MWGLEGERTRASPPFRECRSWVKSAMLAVGRSLPVYPDNRTSSISAATSQKCQERTRAPQQLSSLFDHLVGAGEQCHWNVEAESLSGLEVDIQGNVRRLLDGKLRRTRPFEDAINDARGALP
jgi:hypothetical protein